MLKITGIVALLLVKLSSKKVKHLVKKNEKWVVYVLYNKYIYSVINAVLLLCKKVAKPFKE